MTEPTNESTVIAVLVDDDANDRRLASLLETNKLRVSAIGPLSDVMSTAQAIWAAIEESGGTALVLLDYRLDGDGAAPFRGGSLAATLREQRPEIPIVLFTTEARLVEYVVRRPSIHSLFDFEVLKEHVVSRGDNGRLQAALHSLARGHRQVATAVTRGKAEDNLVEAVVTLILGQVPSDSRAEQVTLVLSTDADPLVESIEIARWIYQRLLKFPGPLLDSSEAAAVLGVTLQSFDTLQSEITSAAYAGVFAEVAPAWWLTSLVALLADVPQSERASYLTTTFGHDLEVAACTWCGETAVARACYICSRASDTAHVLPILMDQPTWSARAVVCFSCIAEGRSDTHQTRFAAGTDEIVTAIKAGEITPDQAAVDKSQELRERWQ